MIRPGIRRLFRLALGRDRSAVDVDEELRLHIELRAEQYIAEGMDPERARAEAARRFGDLPRARRTLHRAARAADTRARWRDRLEGLLLDVRYAARGLLREPGTTLLTVTMLALGIGANAAMFGVIDRLLLQGPAGVREPDRVVRLYMNARAPGIGEFTTGTFGYATYAALRDRARSLQQVAAWSAGPGTFGSGADARLVEIGAATWDFFDLLGVRPIHGRTFTRAEDTPPQGERVVVLDHGLWQSEFGGARDVLGRTLLLGGRPYTIIGVMPPGFTGAALARVDLWIPMSTRSAGVAPDWWSTWSAQWLDVVARLAPGATIERASAEVTMLRRRAFEGDDEVERDATFDVRPLRYDEQGREPAETRVARWLVGVAAIVLLIVCANVANLLLARAMARRQEVAVRLALGISRVRLARLLLLESTLRALLGGAAALVIAWLSARLIRETLLSDVAWPGSPVSGRMLLFTGLAVLVTGVVVGLAPLHQAKHARVGDTIASGARAGGGRRNRLRFGLTVAQAAFSVVLLVGAGLFVRSLLQAGSLRLGMEPERILAVSVNWPSLAGASDSAAAAARRSREVALEQAFERMRSLPGVEQAAIVVGTPFRSVFTIRLRVPGWDSLPRLAGGGPYVAAISPGYFATLGTRIRQGRALDERDGAGAERVAVVNETMARTLWPGRSPLGECLHIGASDTTRAPACTRIVGVVEDVRRSALREEPAMQYFVPLGQDRELGIGGRQLLVRPRGDAAAFIPVLRQATIAMMPGALFVNVQPFTRYLDPLVRPWRLGATLFGLFGLLALVVAVLGLYSVLAYMVVQRTHELGVRRALGAGAAHLLRLVVGHGLAAVGIGCAIGLAAALVAGRFLESLLFETAPNDRLVLGAVTLAMLLAALVASVIPARRAARVDPAVALRGE